MFGLLVSLIFCINSVLSLQLIDLSSAVDYLGGGGSSNDCVIGDSVTSGCLKCTCNGKWYSCSPKPCIKDTSSSEALQKICQPNMIYKLNSTTCICTSGGQWTHDLCLNTFGYLPPDKVVPKTCDPDSYVIIDCNVCKCNSNGTVNMQKCTKNICENESRRSSSSINKVYGNCVPQNWYSFAPCQFCYCVNSNKLVCNTGSKRGGEEITLGTYKLTVCGPNLLKDASGLIPDAQQKIPSSPPPPLRDGIQNKVKQFDPPKSFQNSIQNSISEAFGLFNAKTKATTPHSADIQIDINSDIQMPKESSESEEKKPKPKPVAMSMKPQTELPYYDDDVVSSESNEIEISMTDTAEKAAVTNTLRSINKVSIATELPAFLTDVTNKGSYQINLEDVKMNAIPNKDNTLRINFPLVLDKILNMALRKSNVKLDTVSDCESGTTTKVDCNVCFCLVNGKQLCTDKDCSIHF